MQLYTNFFMYWRLLSNDDPLFKDALHALGLTCFQSEHGWCIEIVERYLIIPILNWHFSWMEDNFNLLSSYLHCSNSFYSMSHTFQPPLLSVNVLIHLYIKWIYITWHLLRTFFDRVTGCPRMISVVFQINIENISQLFIWSLYI